MDMFQQMQTQHQRSVNEMERLHQEAIQRMRASCGTHTGVVVKADHSEYQRYKAEIDAFDVSDFTAVKAAKPQRQLPPRVERADMLEGINSIEDVKAFFNK